MRFINNDKITNNFRNIKVITVITMFYTKIAFWSLQTLEYLARFREQIIATLSRHYRDITTIEGLKQSALQFVSAYPADSDSPASDFASHRSERSHALSYFALCAHK